jgi:hypothetical protein
MTSSTFLDYVGKLKEFTALPILTTSNGIDFPSARQVNDWSQISLKKINEIHYELVSFHFYFQKDFRSKILNKLISINNLYIKLLSYINLKDNSNFSDINFKINQDIKNLEELLLTPKIENITESSFTLSLFETLTKYLIFKNNIREIETTINLIRAEAKKQELLHILNLIINYNNTNSDDKNINTLITDLLYEYKKYALRNVEMEKIKINEEIKNLNKAKEEIELYKLNTLKEVENAKSGLIITAFEERSKNTSSYISILYFLIALLFLIIISSFIFRMAINHNNEFHISSFIYFLSYIIAISGLLAFLIREKNRLVDQKDYFERCHTELRALTTYVVDIDPQKVEDLKLQLAHKYFTGGNNTQPSEKNEISIPDENIKQLIELLNTIQKTNKP